MPRGVRRAQPLDQMGNAAPAAQVERIDAKDHADNAYTPCAAGVEGLRPLATK